MRKILFSLALAFCFYNNKAQTLCFSPTTGSPFAAGTNPYSVCSADFNGDGFADLATANAISNNVSIFLGAGVGSFGTATNFTVGTTPGSVISADFNNDSFKDLATANNGSNNVSILLGTGTGSFGAPASFAVSGTHPGSVISADFNGDGNADLAVVNESSNNVSILLGDGLGSFVASASFAASAFPASVISADFNGDGTADLAIANVNSNDVSILLGTGAGSFGGTISFTVGTHPYSVISSDFNGDGFKDLATANGGSNNVSVLMGNGAGSFATATNFAAGTYPISICSGDFNGDTKLDLAVANYNSINVSVLLGAGTGGFGISTNFGVGTNPSSVISADFDGDLIPDLAVANYGSNNVSVLLNTALPSIDISGTTTICAGGTTTLTASGASTYTWSANVGSATTSTVSITPSITDTYTVTGVTGACSNTQTIAVNTYSFIASISATTPIVCGDSTDIFASDTYQGSGTISYTWSPTTGLNNAHLQTIKSGAKTSTTYTVKEVSTEGCIATDTMSIIVTPVQLNASSYTSSILCSTKDTLYVTNNYPGVGAVTYTWSPSSSLNLPHSAKPTAHPIANTDYTVSASSSDGCIATPQTISITVDAITVNASSNSSNITCGDATQLTESNNYPGAGTLSYAWSPSTALSSASVSTPTANPISTTTYSLTIHTSDGCTGFNQTTINVNPLQINTTSQYSVGCHATVNLSTSSNSSNSDLTYTWTPSLGLSSTTVASPNAAVYHNTTYNVTMSLPSSGCANASNSANISFTIPSTPQICMVTVDSTSSYNTVYWDKTSYAGAAIDSFRIYRETSTNVYTQIGAVAYNSMSAFNDLEANPNTTTYRYKLSALDSCGNESALSYYHNTIYIISVGGGQFTWNPGYTIESSANPVTNYVLMRDDNNTGNFQQIASTSGTQNSINDVSYASHQSTANWRVDALGFNCNPSLRLAGGNNGTDAAKVKSHSNQNNNRTSSINKVAGNTQVIVYPNPANNVLNIDFAKPTTAVSVKITSLFGTEVYNSNQLPLSGNNLAIDISKFESGTYLVQITTDKVSEIKKIVKQ